MSYRSWYRAQLAKRARAAVKKYWIAKVQWAIKKYWAKKVYHTLMRNSWNTWNTWSSNIRNTWSSNIRNTWSSNIRNTWSSNTIWNTWVLYRGGGIHSSHSNSYHKPIPPKPKPKPISITTDVFNKPWKSPERQAVAKKFGINNYTWTKAQNLILKKKIQEYQKTWSKDINKILGNKITTITPDKAFSYKWNSPERQAVAKKFGINNYTWTKAQNLILKKKIQEYQKGANKSTFSSILPSRITWKKSNSNLNSNSNSNSSPSPSSNSSSNKQNLEELKKLRLKWLSDQDILNRAKKAWYSAEKISKIQAFLSGNPLRAWDEKLNSNIIDKTKEDIAKKKVDVLEENRDYNIAKTAEDYLKASNIEKTNNKSLQDFYKNIQKDLKKVIDNNTKLYNLTLKNTKQSNLNRVAGQVRAALARRWIKVSEIPLEQLLALSGQFGWQAITNINNAILKTTKAINEMTAKNMDKINWYKEKWLLKQYEADKEIERLRELKEKLISSIKWNYINNVFKIADTEKNRQTNEKAKIINSILKIWTQIGLQSDQLWLLRQYLDSKDTVSAIQKLIEDLNDKNSDISKAIADNKKKEELKAQLEQQLKLKLAYAKGSWSWTKPINIPSWLATYLAWLDWFPYPIDKSLTVEKLRQILNSWELWETMTKNIKAVLNKFIPNLTSSKNTTEKKASKEENLNKLSNGTYTLSWAWSIN